MPSPDEILANWRGTVDNHFSKTIADAFALPANDDYVYRAESFAMTLRQVQEQIDTGKLKYKYQSHGQQIEVPSADINAYTSIFAPTTDTSKALTSLAANAKKGSPRETVAKYLQSRRKCLFKVPRAKAHINPYYDMWVLSCQETAFLGPLPDPSYASPANAKHTHPILPLFYHHFGCVVPSYEALHIVSQVVADAKADGVIDMASGNGYWTYMLRAMKVDVVAVDNMASEYRTMWIEDTVKADGVEYLKKNTGGRGKVLLMVYMVTAGSFTQRVLQAYRGNIIVVVGTQNANRYTGFADVTTEEYFENYMPGWELVCRIPVPSFAGKDEAMFVWIR
ncbi:uncharacterized protein L3040_000046 [Drepanopeziza brunnea f. sp. 'multigermtubi']|uniref:Uncharacterized protein n=1 Tax=Marssonina brunnea f. sp. multigermtubi (strain MB_m1) TaxID=1072389 RepID=K1WB48_MARBU|nr:uncharacterized protein MBM_07246 [Drepanopeziza brunnea f. sp. 'multigermtubi' MB_m1]EKD14525.1 hypothetical protein MBM_07246 [Drepanopeziza brunnea f. sp. 'multigermtubi' MB_m1]KAJ5053755.1 hypothetical protein L3040_000046 [Drepanopeziza brunnea f. sp. 'multigermtubi']